MGSLVLYMGYFASVNTLGTYFFVFLSANIWGDLTAIAGSLLAYQGYLGWPPLVLATFLGVFTGDNIVYQLGKRLKRHPWGEWIEAHLPYHTKISRLLERNHLEALTLSKFIMGFNLPILFMCGYCNVSVRKFMKSAFVSALIWTVVIFPIGYLVATTYYGLGKLGLRRVEFGVALVITAVFFFRIVLKKIATKIDPNVYEEVKTSSIRAMESTK